MGPALLFGAPSRRLIHLPTFLLANIIVDIEPLLVWRLHLNYPVHGFFHTFLSAVLVGTLLGYFMYWLEPFLHDIYSALRLVPETKLHLRHFIAAGIIGIILHVVLDSIVYTNITPLYPLQVNPFYTPGSMSTVVDFCVKSFIVGLAFYIIVLIREQVFTRRLRKY